MNLSMFIQGLYRGNIGIMEKNMESAIWGFEV